jgi:hypothetical protein
MVSYMGDAPVIRVIRVKTGSGGLVIGLKDVEAENGR